MSVNIRPVCGRIVLFVKPEAPETEVGGIIVRGKCRRDGYREAVVKGLPNGYRGGLSTGQTVLLPPYKGTEVKVNGETLAIVREEDLAAVLED